LSPAPILEIAERYRGSVLDWDTGRTVGPDELARIRESLVSLFRRHGLAAGDRVLFTLPNCPHFLPALIALLACEASPLLLHAQTPAAELARYAQRFGMRFLVSEPHDDPARAALELSGANWDLGPGCPLHFGRLNVPDDAFHGPLLRGVPLHPTSGSTGLPKIALRPGLPVLEEARHYEATLQVEASDLIAAVPPLTHAYAYGCCGMTALLTGASLVTARKFGPTQIQQVLREQPVTILPTVPAMIDMLLFAGDVAAQRLRWLFAAGALLPKRSADQFRARYGLPVCPVYGTTETGTIAIATAADGQDVDGRVGPPMAGVEVKILPARSEDLETSTALPTTEAEPSAAVDPAAPWGSGVGRLLVKSSSQMTGYLDQVGNLTNPLTEGWFETGDLARLVEGNLIQLRGRSSEVINVAGLKVVPCEVEEAIATLPGVREVKVYAGEQRSGSQFVKAAVAVDPPLTVTDIRLHCERELVYYKRPQAILMLPALPRSATGKILRDQLP